MRERVWKAGWDMCVVINKERIVLGQLREKELSSDLKSPVEASAIDEFLGEVEEGRHSEKRVHQLPSRMGQVRPEAIHTVLQRGRWRCCATWLAGVPTTRSPKSCL